jgi:hypothetical protein
MSFESLVDCFAVIRHHNSTLRHDPTIQMIAACQESGDIVTLLLLYIKIPTINIQTDIQVSTKIINDAFCKTKNANTLRKQSAARLDEKQLIHASSEAILTPASEGSQILDAIHIRLRQDDRLPVPT